jgi:glycosyltransferase involved in cell wall biosynthesis
VGLAVPEPGTLVYAGAPTFAFNLEAVQWFARDVLPLVSAAEPACRLRVTGTYEPVADVVPTGAHIEYTGHLADVRPAVAGAWVSIVPLQRGGGTRLKVLESLALGTPVVSTSKGIEGLDLVPGEEVLVADDAGAFSDCVTRVLHDAALRTRLSVAGRAAVEQRHDWRPIATRFTDLVAHLAARRATA